MSRLISIFALVLGAQLAMLAPAAAQAAEQHAADSGGGATPAEPARPSEVVRELERSVSRVQHLLAETRRGGRDQHASCVNDTLSQITATLRLALERTQRTARYERERNAEMAARERALVARLLPRGRELERAAQRCVNPDMDLESGRTRVTTTIDPRVPRDAVTTPRPRDGAVYE